MAIALDVATNGGFVDPGTSRTWSHTCSGSNRILWVGIIATSGSDVISGVTYNSTSMSRAIMSSNQSSNRVYMYVLTTPSSGANNVVVSLNTSTSAGCLSVSYTGANSTGQPNETGETISGATAGITASIASQASGSWIVGFGQAIGGTGSGYAAGTNTTQRVANDGFGRFRAFDSNGTTTTSLQYSWTSNDNAILTVAEMLESGGAPTQRYDFLLLGVGT